MPDEDIEKVAREIVPDSLVELGTEEKVRCDWENLRKKIITALRRERERAERAIQDLRLERDAAYDKSQDYYQDGYRMGLEDAHKCERRHAEIDSLEAKLKLAEGLVEALEHYGSQNEEPDDGNIADEAIRAYREAGK